MINGLIYYFIWAFIGLPILTYLCGYMFTRGVIRGVLETLNKIYRNEKEQKEK